MTTIPDTIPATRADTNQSFVQPSAQPPNRIKFSLSEGLLVMYAKPSGETQPFDLEAVDAWVGEAQALLKKHHLARINPVSVEGDTIHIDESAMLYDTVYPVKVGEQTYHIVFTSDGALEIYEVAP